MYNNILIPIAPDHEYDLSEVLEVARAVSAEGAKITALTVIENIPAYVSTQLPIGLIEENRSNIASSLQAELISEPGVEAVAVIGHSATTILEKAADMAVDCIVMTSHRPGLTDYFLGSTAARVVRHAQCSVHIVR